MGVSCVEPSIVSSRRRLARSPSSNSRRGVSASKIGEQVQLYLQALEHVFPGASIEARVVYTARRSGHAV